MEGLLRSDVKSFFRTSFGHGLGIAFVFTPGTVLTMEGVPAEHSGAVSGLLQMDQQIEGALGIAAVMSVFAAAAAPGDFMSGLPTAFSVAAAFSFVAACTTLILIIKRGASK